MGRLTEQNPLTEITLLPGIPAVHEPRLELMTEILDDLVHMRFQRQDSVHRVVATYRSLLSGVFLGVRLAEEVVDYMSLYHHTACMVIVRLSPVALGGEDGLHHSGRVDIQHIRRYANHWAMLMVQLLEHLVETATRDVVETPEVCPFWAC